MAWRRALISWFSLALIIAPATAAVAQQSEPPVQAAAVNPSQATGLFAEPKIFTTLLDASDRRFGEGRVQDAGPYVEFGNMITGAGWISAEPGYRRPLLDGHAVVDVSAALSWNLYWNAQGRFEFPHLAHDRVSVGTQAMYQDLLAVEYFGLRNDSLETNRSAYRLNNFDLLGYSTIRPKTWLTVDGRFGWIDRPDISTAITPYGSVLNTIDRFTETTAPGIGSQPPFLHGDVSIAGDCRDSMDHPTRGGIYRASAASYSDRSSGVNSFQQYEVGAAQFVPLFRSNWILALRASEVFSVASTGHVVPFYLMPSLGGGNTLRGYDNYRFHDNNLQVFNVESRLALSAHIDLAAFADAGKVASRAGDLDFRQLKTSYGAGLRVHSRKATLGLVDVGHSREGWRIVFSMSDPLRRSKPAWGRPSVVPFVP